jgi:type I restriction enzyme, S subunit
MLDKAKNKGDLLPYLANINVRWGEFDLADLREMRFEPHEIERYSVRPGDILMCEGGEPGRCAPWKGQRENMMFQKALHRIRPHLCLDRTFLYYAFLNTGQSNGFAPYFTGATIKHLPREQLAKVPIRFPDLRTQQAIASVLSAYDDLIATNQRRIALLEAAARRLYREWFVHLRFPGHESVPVGDGVPEVWQSLPLTQVADFINGFAFKPEHQQEEGLPIVKIPELRDGVGRKTPRNSGVEIPARNHIDTGDVLFSWSATLLVNEWGEGPALLNQHLFKVAPRNPTHKRLIRFAVETAIPLLLGQSVGATMQHIRRSALDAHLMLVPAQPIADAFAALVDPMIDMALNLSGQNRQLIVARDLLLPKLMSGQLDVSRIQLPEETAAE